MDEVSNIYPNLSNQIQFRLNKTNEIKDYFIREREAISKWFSKYIAALDCFDKSLIVLSATSYRISIASFPTVLEQLFFFFLYQGFL